MQPEEIQLLRAPTSNDSKMLNPTAPAEKSVFNYAKTRIDECPSFGIAREYFIASGL